MKLKYIFLFLFSLTQFLFSQNTEVIRIVTYNILNYPNNSSSRNSYFKQILDEISPDIVVVQEMTSQYGVNTFLSNVLNPSFVKGAFIDGPDTDNAIFYKDSLFTLVSHIAIPTDLRNISQFTLYHNLTGDTLIIYSVHLKASEGSFEEQQRLAEVNELRNVTDVLPVGTNFIVLGDFNIYRSSEPAYQKLIEQVNSGYFIDSQPAGDWHNNSSYAEYHTQSPCDLQSCPNGGSNGGMDDRFDMILISQAVKDSGRVKLIDTTYTPFGNDGQHFNQSINEPPYTVITEEIADALFNSSDHLPVFADFDFGTVSDVEDISPSELSFNLFQNYPNPFNPGTIIRYQLAASSLVLLKVYDILGREVITLVNEEKPAGEYKVEFNAKNLSSGVYIYRLSTQEYNASKKLTIIK
jgi:exonuclease III